MGIMGIMGYVMAIGTEFFPALQRDLPIIAIAAYTSTINHHPGWLE
jgi:hypothetical protein